MSITSRSRRARSATSLSSSDVDADSHNSHRLSVAVYLNRAACCHPVHTAVWKHNTKFGVVNFTLFDRPLNCLSHTIPILEMYARNKVVESNCSRRSEPQNLTTRRRHRDFVFV